MSFYHIVNMESIHELVVIANENYKEWKRLAEKENDKEEMKRLFNKSIFWLETYSVALFLSVLENFKKDLKGGKREEIEKIIRIGKSKIVERLAKYAFKSANELEKMLGKG